MTDKKVLTQREGASYGEPSPPPARSGQPAVNGVTPHVLGGVADPLPWYLLRVYRPFGEDYKVFNEITKLGFRAHLPRYVEYKELKKHGRPVFQNGRKVEVETIRSLYPGYIFVSFALTEPGWGRILQVPGVISIFCRRTEAALVPVRIPAGKVEDLMNQGRAGDGAIDERKPAFKAIPLSSEVRIKSGPWEGHAGFWQMDEKGRLGVLLKVFGDERVVEMSAGSVEAVVAQAS